MSILSNHAEVTAKWRGLPNVKCVASYNFVDQVVLFEDLEATDVEACLTRATPAARWPLRKKVWVNAWHEYTHWLDMTTSVFGLRWLCTLVDLLERHPADGEIPSQAYVDKCKAATREMASIHLPAYYSTVEHAAGRPWVYSSTVGQAFDSQGKSNPDHPLWFVRFNTSSGLPIARQPISVASLLEVRAVEAELVGGLGLMDALPDRDFQLIEKHQFSQDIIARLYEPHLTVYSAAAHWFANHRGIADAAEAYRAASKLAWFCLDTPTQWVTSLKATSEFGARMGDQFAGMMSTSLARGDRGALFFMLASDSRLRSLKSLRNDLSGLLQTAWNVSLKDVEQAGEKERSELVNRLVRTAGPVSQLAQIWNRNLSRRSPDNPLSVASRGIALPAIILADDTPFDVFSMGLRDRAFGHLTFDPRPYFEEFLKLDLAMSKHGRYSEHGLHCFSVAPT